MLLVECPHCNNLVQIESINCAIFRHGFDVKRGIQIPPHSKKEVCEKYLLNPDIVGCCKPFKIVKVDDEFKAVICDYI